MAKLQPHELDSAFSKHLQALEAQRSLKRARKLDARIRKAKKILKKSSQAMEFIKDVEARVANGPRVRFADGLIREPTRCSRNKTQKPILKNESPRDQRAWRRLEREHIALFRRK